MLRGARYGNIILDNEHRHPDQPAAWVPYGGDGDNRWVNVGIWSGGDTCVVSPPPPTPPPVRLDVVYSALRPLTARACAASPRDPGRAVREPRLGDGPVIH